jgi:hypothetical protein
MDWHHGPCFDGSSSPWRSTMNWRPSTRSHTWSGPWISTPLTLYIASLLGRRTKSYWGVWKSLQWPPPGRSVPRSAEEKDPTCRGIPAGVCARHRPLRSPSPSIPIRTQYRQISCPFIRRQSKGARNKTTDTLGVQEGTQQGLQSGPRGWSNRCSSRNVSGPRSPGSSGRPSPSQRNEETTDGSYAGIAAAPATFEETASRNRTKKTTGLGYETTNIGGTTRSRREGNNDPRKTKGGGRKGATDPRKMNTSRRKMVNAGVSIPAPTSHSK